MSVPKQNQLTAELVRQRFDYNKETGILTYSGRERANKPPSQRSKRTGMAAGWPDTYGYLNVRIDKRCYLVHRVIWLHVTGEWPDGVVDHLNRSRADNRWENMRLTNQAENMHNMADGYAGSASGVIGVSPGKTPGTWLANIRAKGVPIRLGTFGSKDLAHSAYINAKALLHPSSPVVSGVKVVRSKFTKTAIKNLRLAGYEV